MRQVIAAVLVGLSLSGCTATYIQRDLIEATGKLSRSKSVLVSTPANGVYGKVEYKSSGKITAHETRMAFAAFAPNTAVVSDCKDLQCLATQSTAGSSYLVVPQILHWEDRATEWSGIPDRIEVEVRVFDGSSLQELSATVISGKSKWATFGGDHPEDLLPEPLKIYTQSLYEMPR